MDDAIYLASTAPGQGARGTAGVRGWLVQRALDAGGVLPNVTIHAHASFETPDRADQDQKLSERRMDVAAGVVHSLANITAQQAHGFDGVNASNNQADRVAIITLATTQPGGSATLKVSRAARGQPTQAVEKKPVSPPTPLPKQPPSVFRRVGIRVKVLRNDPVLIELTGELDFETELERTLRNPAAPAAPTGGKLELKRQDGAVTPRPNYNPKDGVVDFRLTIVHDPATHAWTETLAIGAHPNDVNGLLQVTNDHGSTLTAENRIKDLLGSVMILTPIIGTAVGAMDPNSAGSYAVLGGALVGAAAIGAAGFIQTQKITLYGGELRFREFIPPNDPAAFTDAGVLFDYAVEFGVEIKSLGIGTRKPLKVRYRAIGFNLNFAGGGYQPIFDTSKGYELDLSDPGLFKLPSPIDNVLKIFGARIAKVNPLTVELDLGLKVDLGVVSIDRFKVKLPVDPPGVPTILPSGLKVDISNVLVGSGYVNIIEPPAEPADDDRSPSFGGIEGQFDITLVPVKLRIAASFGIRPVESPDKKRKATAVFLGMVVDLPSPIVLVPPVGIYGFSGLFAMHYKRVESDPDPDPSDAIGPAILWLRDAGGEPTRLFNDNVRLWDTEIDRWSFGVGVRLGTNEGGFLVNLRGMFVLELPGPRILIFVNVLIVKVLPDSEAGEEPDGRHPGGGRSRFRTRHLHDRDHRRHHHQGDHLRRHPGRVLRRFQAGEPLAPLRRDVWDAGVGDDSQHRPRLRLRDDGRPRHSRSGGAVGDRVARLRTHAHAAGHGDGGRRRRLDRLRRRGHRAVREGLPARRRRGDVLAAAAPVWTGKARRRTAALHRVDRRARHARRRSTRPDAAQRRDLRPHRPVLLLGRGLRQGRDRPQAAGARAAADRAQRLAAEPCAGHYGRSGRRPADRRQPG